MLLPYKKTLQIATFNNQEISRRVRLPYVRLAFTFANQFSIFSKSSCLETSPKNYY